MCIVEDDKVSVDALTETIQEFEDFVQSVDTAAFNKIYFSHIQSYKVETVNTSARRNTLGNTSNHTIAIIDF